MAPYFYRLNHSCWLMSSLSHQLPILPRIFPHTQSRLGWPRSPVQFFQPYPHYAGLFQNWLFWHTHQERPIKVFRSWRNHQTNMLTWKDCPGHRLDWSLWVVTPHQVYNGLSRECHNWVTWRADTEVRYQIKRYCNPEDHMHQWLGHPWHKRAVGALQLITKKSTS